MKMQAMDMEIIVFDQEDVIATSVGGDPGVSTIQTIWLSTESVDNFNNYANKIGNPLTLNTMFTSSHTYHAFNGLFQSNAFYSIQGSNDSATEKQDGYRTVGKNGENYASVLAWLNSK